MRVFKGDTPPPPPFTIKEYEASAYWKKKSKAILDNKDAVCYVCQRNRWKWQPRAKKWKRMYKASCHHVRYTNIPYEKEGDLIVVCGCCHTLFHQLLRLESLGGPYIELATTAKKYFPYEKHTYVKVVKGGV